VLLVLLGAGLSACDDPLPAFANPPPYDGGDDRDGSVDDDDAG
jgi:hypothetical protein